MVIEVDEVRLDYLKRLIKGVRKQTDKDPETIEAKEELGDEVTIARWVDANLLCMVIEKDILGIEDD